MEMPMNHQDQTLRDRQARDIFLRAVEIQSAEARAGFLEGACQNDVSLRSRVEALLKSHKQDSFLEAAAVEGAPTLISETRVTEGPGAVIDHYKLLQKLGEGGFGVVYLAEQKEPVKRRVALKIIKLGMDTQQVVARFEAERQALAMMDHPNIAKVLDAGATETGRPYFVMELVKGVPVTKYCDDNQLTTKERLDLFIAVCQAIQHAHQKGIIHRDIKPSNILVTLHDGVPVPKVIDFGIAKATQQELTEKTIFTQHGQFIGTPAYMSPEQAEMSGLDIDTRSDIYSLGVVLYELLVGRTPLDGKELMSGGYEEIRRRIKEEEPAKPSTKASTLDGVEQTNVAKHRKLNPGQLSNELRGDLDWIVMKALEKDRTRRYETANGFAADIRRHLSNEPVIARPPSAAYRFEKVVRRNRLAFAALAAVGIALLLGASLAIVGWQQARFERDKALAARSEAETARVGESIERQRAETAQAKEAQLRSRAEIQDLIARRRAYAADMNRIQQELSANHLRRARELLGRYYPKAGEKDLRGWEWRYLWQRCRGDALVKFHQEPVGGIWYAGYTSNGEQFVTCDRYVGIKCWDSVSRKEVANLQTPSPPPNDSWAFIKAPRLSDDGTLLAAPVWNGLHWVIKVWEMEGKKIVTELSFGEKASITALALSRDNKLMAVLVAEQGVSLWEVGSGKRVAQLPSGMGRSEILGAVVFSPDQKVLAIGEDSGRVRIVDLATLRETQSFMASRTDDVSGDHGVLALSFSPDGRELAVGCAFQNPRITIWDMRDKKRLATLEGHQGFVSSLAFSPDGTTLASAGGDHLIKLWNTTSWKEESTLKGHTEEVWSVSFSRNGQRLISAGKDGAVYLWPARVAPPPREEFELTTNLKRADVSPDGQTIGAILQDGSVALWDVPLGQRKTTTVTFGTNNTAIFFSPTGEMLLGSADPPQMKVHNPPRDSLSTYPLTWSSQPDAFWFLPRNRMIFAASVEANPQVAKFQRWDAVSRQELPPIPVGRALVTGQDFFEIAFASDEPLMAIVSGQSLVIRNIETGQEECSLPFPHGSPVTGIAFVPGKKMVVASSFEAPIIHAWDLTKRERIASFSGHNQLHLTSNPSPDGLRLLTTAVGFEPMKLWDTDSWEEAVNLDVPGARLSRERFLPDGNTIVAFSSNGKVHFWRAPSWEEIESAEKPRIKLP